MCAKKQGSLEDLAVVGVDIGKDVFHLVGFDRSGQVVLRRKIKRFALQETFDALPRCIVGMEACLSAHFVSRGLRKLGFEPRIIPAIYVKPFNKGQKNDYNDAKALPKRLCARTCGPCRRRIRISWTYRRCTGSGPAWCHAAPPPSTRSAPS